MEPITKAQMWKMKGIQPPDQYCPDRVICSGWRKVRKGGRVKFAASWWKHDKLKDYEGKYVYITPNEYWITAVDIHYPGMMDFVVRAKDS